MTQEQKARAYDEAKLRIRAAYNSNRCTIGFMNEIFPELKESDDEKIKNKLINLIKMSSEVGGLALHKWEADEMLTWLEKQDKQKPAWSEDDKKMFVNIKACLRNANKDYSREIDWLKSINPHPKNEWSEEDERIRRFIISGMTALKEQGKETFATIPINDCITWLKKQGETFTKKDVDDAYLKGVTDTKNEIEKQYEENSQIRKDIATFIFNYRGIIKDRAKWIDYLGIKVSLVEKQGEQKPAFEMITPEESLGITSEEWNKIEDECIFGEDKPRFKVGDWIVSGYNSVAYIESISETKYNLQCKDGFHEKLSVDYINRCWHLWTIQDAKDGDVLFHSDSASNGIFIFKEIRHDGKVLCYCDYDSEDGFCLGEKHTCCWTNAKILHPATKEQRDTLFAKMKEAGYEWNTEKKTFN